MEPILLEKLLTRLAVCPEQFLPHCDEVHSRCVAKKRSLLAKCTNQPVRLDDLVALRPARRTARDFDVADLRLRQSCAHLCNECLEILHHHIGRLARVDVIAPGENHHCRRLVRDEDALGKNHRVLHLRSAEAAVHDAESGEGICESFPSRDGRAAGEDDAALLRRMIAVRLLKCRDGLLPFRRLGDSGGCENERRKGDGCGEFHRRISSLRTGETNGNFVHRSRRGRRRAG